MNAVIAERQSDLVKLCREFHVQRLDLFGSALSAGFGLDPDDRSASMQRLDTGNKFVERVIGHEVKTSLRVPYGLD